MRKHWHIDKTRETFHHHAIDASIIAATPFLNIWKKGGSIFPVKVNEGSIDIETGEILDDNQFDKSMYEQPYSGFVSEIMNADDRIKFSHQVDKKTNRSVSKATIYSTRTGKLAKEKKNQNILWPRLKISMMLKNIRRLRTSTTKIKQNFYYLNTICKVLKD